MQIYKNKIKGFTLIELLLITGIISTAGALTYLIYQSSNDARKVKTEMQSLTSIIRDLENYSLAKGDLTGISLSNIQNFSQNFQPSLELQNISSTANNVTFNYINVNSRVCNNFVEKILSSNKNISIKINEQNISNNLTSIVNSCVDKNNNDIEITYNKPINSNSISIVTASVNTPPPPAIDVVVPADPIPANFPTIPAFIPPTLKLDNYGITGTAPVYPTISPSGGPISVTPGGIGGGNVTPPTWNPPGYTPAPPATSAGVDEIDQNVLPPPPPPPPPPAIPLTYSKTIILAGVRSGSIVYTLTLNNADDNVGILEPSILGAGSFIRIYTLNNKNEIVAYRTEIVNKQLVTYMSLANFKDWTTYYVEEIERGS